MKIQPYDYLKSVSETFNNSVIEYTRVVEMIIKCIKSGSTIWIIGNGGSASTAEHFETDLLMIRNLEIENKIKVFALSSNSSLCSALANDLGYENVFSFQLQRKASPGDLCIAFSASGNSTNIINAIKFANENSIETFAIVGFDGGSLLSMTKNTIHIRSEIGLYGPIEDIHLYICHNITDQVKKRLKQNEFN